MTISHILVCDFDFQLNSEELLKKMPNHPIFGISVFAEMYSNPDKYSYFGTRLSCLARNRINTFNKDKIYSTSKDAIFSMYVFYFHHHNSLYSFLHDKYNNT